MKFKGLLALSFIPLILTGCSSGMTPSFGNHQNATITDSSPVDEVPSEEGHENDDSKSDKETQGKNEDSKDRKNENEDNETDKANNETDKAKDSKNKKEGVYELSEEEKKIGMKLDANGNPYFAGSNPDDGIISVEPSIQGDENTKNTSIYDPSESDFNAVIKVGNEYIKNIKAKKWKKACSNVYEVEGRNCASHLESIYKGGNTFVEYTKDNVTGVTLSKKSMNIALKDKGYEDNQRMTFVKDDGAWKILIK